MLHLYHLKWLYSVIKIRNCRFMTDPSMQLLVMLNRSLRGVGSFGVFESICLGMTCQSHCELFRIKMHNYSTFVYVLFIRKCHVLSCFRAIKVQFTLFNRLKIYFQDKGKSNTKRFEKGKTLLMLEVSS